MEKRYYSPELKEQAITLGKGATQETVVVKSATYFRRFWWRQRSGDGPATYVTLTEPVSKQHNVGEEALGSGITFSRPLSKSYEKWGQIASGTPTAGAPTNIK